MEKLKDGNLALYLSAVYVQIYNDDRLLTLHNPINSHTVFHTVIYSRVYFLLSGLMTM